MDAGPGREPEGEVSRTRKRVGGLARPSQGAMSGIESLVTNFPFVYSTDVCLLFTGPGRGPGAPEKRDTVLDLQTTSSGGGDGSRV